MPSESQVLRCGNCGANLSPVVGQNIVQCSYCDQSTYLTATVVAPLQKELAEVAAHPERPTGLHERLLGGADVEPRCGRGTRLTTRDMKREQLVPAERAIWPSGASASTTYGGSWSPSAMVGPPKVFPRYGDIGGAWAPSSSSSAVEWVELQYTSDEPVTALRVYETNKSGSVYAVVDRSGPRDELLYAGPKDPRTEACALEVTLDAPRVIRRLRVYLTNRPGYAEIDTVALLTRDPLPVAQRRVIPPPTRELSFEGCMGLGAVLLVALIVLVIVLVKRTDAPDASAEMAATYPLIAGATLTPSQPSLEAVLGRSPRWANAVVDFSSEYSDTTNSAERILGLPDVYPQAGDLPRAWAPLPADGGIQYITVGFPDGPPVGGVLWLATLGPGAVVRVDDLSDPAQPATLFRGDDPSGGTGSAALELRLAAPRPIRTLRLYLDTDRQAGWSEIDAIGLVP